MFFTCTSFQLEICFDLVTFVSVTGNFLTIALMAGSKALSVKNPGLDLASEHACKQEISVSNTSIKFHQNVILIFDSPRSDQI